MYELPVAKRSIKQNQFPFTAAGKSYTLPLMKLLPIGVAAKFETGKTADMLDAFVEILDGPEPRAFVEGLDTEQLEALMKAWQDASGVSVGESEGSASS